MWFAIGFIGIIALATGITLLPGGEPQKSPPASAVAASPTSPAPPAGGTR